MIRCSKVRNSILRLAFPSIVICARYLHFLLQLCTGVPSGCEAAVYAMSKLFNDGNIQGVLLIDAANAFNSLNRNVALHNMNYVCPAITTILNNCYRQPTRLIIPGEGEITSQEGTTQGDPLGMAMFALAMVPMILDLSKKCPPIVQTWFADDASGAGSLQNLKQWWDSLNSIGPSYGYYPKASKSCLVVHPADEEVARDVFSASDINITTEGKRYLGAALGSTSFIEDFVKTKVEEWNVEIERLANVAGSQPQAAYAAFIHGTCSKWKYLCRTVPHRGPLLQPIEDKLHQRLIPAITGRPPCSQAERSLLALPIKMGGLALANPVTTANQDYESSTSITSTLAQDILNQATAFQNDPTTPSPLLLVAKKEKKQQNEKDFVNAYEAASLHTQRLIDCAREPGASAWISAMPLEEHGFCLDKSSFRDALCLRYGWQLPNMSHKCACGIPLTVDHAMVCHKGGIPTQRHNEICDLTAALLAEICPNVSSEPHLQPIDNEEFHHRTAIRDEARADIKASNFWLRGKDAFFDVRVFYPSASSYRQKELSTIYKTHENEKKRSYGQRIRDVERASFTPLVFASTGGMAKECTIFFKRLADILAEKKKIAFSKMMYLIRCKISFALLRSSICAVRSSRSSRSSYPTIGPDSDYHRMYAEAL